MITKKKQIELVKRAIAARQNAYAPYSKYRVGAALLTQSGKVFTGVNVENAAYPTGMCAERVAVFKAVSEGEKDFEAIAVVTANSGSPCGSCRQVLSEFGLDIVVIIANVEGEIAEVISVRDLLPGAFGPEDLSALDS